MKSTRIKLLAMAAIATLVTVSAQAQTITGSLWENDPTGAGDAEPSMVPLSTPDVTFSVNGNINFQSGGLYTIGEFLSSGGATILTGAGELGNSADNLIFNFTGLVTVTTGQSFIAGHDDGLTLIINGVTVISAPGPTSFDTTTDIYSGPSGTFPFQLVYGECCGAPADLEVTLPLQNAPDGGSTMALLGGALAMMGAVARRFRK